MLNTTTQPERTEGPVAKSIERETSKLPSDWFLWGALAAAGTSFALQLMDRRERSLFIGQWVPTLLLFGVYNKIVKVAGSDRWDTDANQLHGSSGPAVDQPASRY